MTKLSQLKIDPEFQNQINPPSFEETHQLEMNILKEERVLNPIITWNGYIVDGHLQHRRLSIPQPEAADRHHQPDAGRDTTPTGYRSCPHLRPAVGNVHSDLLHWGQLTEGERTGKAETTEITGRINVSL